jgi:tripartite-type tricarboxylate transporter receptor subunit TctC
MRTDRRQLMALLASGLAMWGMTPTTWAQSGAGQAPIKLIVPFTPGTGIDLIARTLGPKLSQKLNRSVVVENRVGASGNIGTEAVVRAAPDGNTLLVSVNTLVMNRLQNGH